jgi:hypothetical protein
MKNGLRAVVVALGLTTIYAAWLVEPLVKPNHNIVYHWSGRPWVLFGPVAFYIAVIWATLARVLVSAQRPGRWRTAVWMAVLLWIPWIVAKTLGLDWQVRVPWQLIPRSSVVLIVLVLLIVLWRPAFSAWYELAIEFASTVLMFVALSGAFFLAEFMWCWWQAPKLMTAYSQASASNHSDPEPRIFFIILDELSYKQVYESRYPGLRLPAFDALANQAVVFTHVVPAGNFTERAVPSLLTGHLLDGVRLSADGRSSFHHAESGAWQPFDEHDTVFEDADRSGYTTTVAGWYNPYCRLLPTVLHTCYWSHVNDTYQGIAANETFGSNLRAPLGMLIPRDRWQHPLTRWLNVPDLERRTRKTQVADYENLLAATDAVLREPSAGFVLLHVPVPHPPGIYNRTTGQMTTGDASYIDNLALADVYLGHMRKILTETGQWDASTIVVMGDHSWRTSFLWKALGIWTMEDDRASSGAQFDDRPGYIVKLAGEKTGARIDEPFHALKTRKLFDELMAGSLRTPDDLQRWVGQVESTDVTRASR